MVDAPVSKALAKLWAWTGRPPSWAYVHAGDELEFDVRNSPFLKHAKYDVVGLHNLETCTCLHLVDGREGAAGAGEQDLRRALLVARVPAWWYRVSGRRTERRRGWMKKLLDSLLFEYLNS